MTEEKGDEQSLFYKKTHCLFLASGEIGIRCTRLWNYMELFWNSLDNAPSSIVFYLEMKVEVEVGVTR